MFLSTHPLLHASFSSRPSLPPPQNPVPRTTTHEDQTGDGYPANCPNTDDAPCVGADNGFDPVSSTLEIIDHVVIPAGLTPGQWVLGWRWDW